VSDRTIATKAVGVNATASTSVPPAGPSSVGEVGEPSALYEKILSVSFRVKNTGALAGNEVSQLYLGFPSAYGEPPKMLRGFAQTMLAREQTKTVIIPLRQKDVSVWDVVSQQWVSSSRTIHLEGTVQL
jgi:beta-glucosidase